MGRIASISLVLITIFIGIFILGWMLLGVNFLIGLNLFSLASDMLIFSGVSFVAFTILFLIDIIIIGKSMSERKRPITYKKTEKSKISIVMPAYNEASGISNVVNDFLSQKGVTEVVVIDNGSNDGTGEKARKAGARVIRIDPNRGFGYASFLAMKAARGNLIVLIESDSTQKGADLKKLLPYLENVDMVMGTRTTAEFINTGAAMDWFLRWGNIFLAKLVQIRFNNKLRMTDAACAFRVMKRKPLRMLLRQMKIFDNTFLPYMNILALKNGLKIVEVPISYNRRVGESKSTGKSRWLAAGLGIKMIWRIITA